MPGPSQRSTDEPRRLDGSDVHDTARWLKRAGLAARGVVYLVVGVLALQIVVRPGSSGGEEASPGGAIEALARQPFGTALLVLLAVGLVAFAVYEVGTGIWLAPPDVGRVRRAGLVVAGLFYLGLAVLSVATAFGGGGSGSDDPSGFTARLLGMPGGRVLVGAVGIGFLVTATYMGWRGVADDFMGRLERREMAAWLERIVARVGTWGLLARAAALGLVGWFVVLSAVRSQPEQARGLDQALRELSRQPYGPWLIAAVALGFLAYGFLSLVEARYRKVQGEG